MSAPFWKWGLASAYLSVNLSLTTAQRLIKSGPNPMTTNTHPFNHASISPFSFLQAGCPSYRPTNSVKTPNPMIIEENTPGECLGCQKVADKL